MKRLKYFLFIFVFGMLFLVPYNTKALENKVVSCDYQFVNSNGKNIELEYEFSHIKNHHIKDVKYVTG